MKGKLTKTGDMWGIIYAKGDDLVETPLHHKELKSYDKLLQLLLYQITIEFEIVNEAYDVTKDAQQILYKDFAVLKEPTNVDEAAIVYSKSSKEDFKLGADWIGNKNYSEDEIVSALRHAEGVTNTSYAKLWTILKTYMDGKKSSNEH